MLRVLLGAGLAAVAGAAVLAIATWYGSTRPPALVAHAQAADGTVFALYAHHPFGDYDPAWFVYEFRSLDAMRAASISSNFGSGAIFETYEEGGDHNTDETIELVSDRFVVVSRAGILHSLYDRDCRELLVHDETPWHSANLSQIEQPKRARVYLEWKLEHLHRKIEAILKVPRPRCAA